MIISTHQPYFCAYPGFFYKAYQSDVFVILDTVQFPRGTTWITRNRFKNDQGIFWMTVPVWKKGLGLQNINGVRICHEGRWAQKHLSSLRHAYANSPYFSDHFKFIEKVYTLRFEKLIDLNLELIHYLMRQLGVGTKIRLLSEMNIATHGEKLLIDICRQLGANDYLAQRSAARYLTVETFQREGITIRYMNPPALIYPQLWGHFIENLSTFDLLFNCGPKSHDILFGNDECRRVVDPKKQPAGQPLPEC